MAKNANTSGVPSGPVKQHKKMAMGLPVTPIKNTGAKTPA